MGKKNTWSKHWNSLTEIGACFNLSAVATGKVLKEHGWKGEDNKPTEAALSKNHAVRCPLANGVDNYRWSRPDVINLLKQLGYELVPRHVTKINLAIKKLASSYRELDRHPLGHKLYPCFVEECQDTIERFKSEEFFEVLDQSKVTKKIKKEIIAAIDSTILKKG